MPLTNSKKYKSLYNKLLEVPIESSNRILRKVSFWAKFKGYIVLHIFLKEVRNIV